MTRSRNAVLPVAAILLAAGRGTRFGGRKLEAKLPDGTPVGLAAWRTLVHVIPDTVVIVREDDAGFRALLVEEGARMVVATAADRGMGASLAAGVADVDPRSAIVVALADMPWIAQSTISAVASAVAAGASLAAPRYRGERGHPIGFAPSHRAALASLDGDEGARTILAAYREAIHFIDVEDAAVLADVDTPDGLQRGGTGGP